MDSGWDPCECVYSTERAMRRLMNILRNTQQNCNENECFPDGRQTEDPSDGGDSMMLMMMMMWAVFVIGMVLTRPASLRGSDPSTKSSPNNNGNGRNPPDVPPVE